MRLCLKIKRGYDGLWTISKTVKKKLSKELFLRAYYTKLDHLSSRNSRGSFIEPINQIFYSHRMHNIFYEINKHKIFCKSS